MAAISVTEWLPCTSQSHLCYEEACLNLLVHLCLVQLCVYNYVTPHSCFHVTSPSRPGDFSPKCHDFPCIQIVSLKSHKSCSCQRSPVSSGWWTTIDSTQNNSSSYGQKTHWWTHTQFYIGICIQIYSWGV